MRTTLTLDDDVAEKLKQLSAKRKLPFRRVVNDVLRRGLTGQVRPREQARVRVETFRSALRAGVDPLKLNQLIDDLEVEDQRDRS